MMRRYSNTYKDKGSNHLSSGSLAPHPYVHPQQAMAMFELKENPSHHQRACQQGRNQSNNNKATKQAQGYLTPPIQTVDKLLHQRSTNYEEQLFNRKSCGEEIQTQRSNRSSGSQQKISNDERLFSFYNSNNNSHEDSDSHEESRIQSLRNDLHNLSKMELVDLLIEEVQDNKNLRAKSYAGENLDENKKYQELASYMEEYVKNTNEVQSHFLSTIEKLKKENLQLKEQINNQKNTNQSQAEETVKMLEAALSEHLSINNSLSTELEKARKQLEKFQQDLTASEEQIDNLKQILHLKQNLKETAQENNGKAEESQHIESFKEDDNNYYEEQLRVLEISNKELRQCCSQMEAALEGKSRKIRKLLEELQQLSEEKWKYKQLYMQSKNNNKYGQQIKVGEEEEEYQSLGQ